VALSLALASAPATAAAQEQPTPGAATPAPSELFLFIYRPGPAWREGVPMRQQGLAPHAAYMQRLLDARRLFAGGGFADDDGGMAIVTAANIEEARTLLAADPAVVGGVFVAEIEHWRPRFRSDAPLPRRK
jgi:uncharacterized protein YciI